MRTFQKVHATHVIHELCELYAASPGKQDQFCKLHEDFDFEINLTLQGSSTVQTRCKLQETEKMKSLEFHELKRVVKLTSASAIHEVHLVFEACDEVMKFINFAKLKQLMKRAKRLKCTSCMKFMSLEHYDRKLCKLATPLKRLEHFMRITQAPV